MKNVQGIELKKESREEHLPDFNADFPYIASYVELDKFIEGYVPWHWHPAVELFYMQSGRLEYTTPGGKWIFPEGSGGFINSNVLHTTRITQRDEPTVSFLHLFHPSLIGGEHGSRIEQKYILPITSARNTEIIPLWPEDEAHSEILELVRMAFELQEEPGYELKLRAILSEIWLKLFMLTCPGEDIPEQGSISGDTIKEIMIYIHENYGQKLTVDELAAKAHISQRACHRLFREMLHMTPVEYITSYRMQEACRMLAKTDTPVTEVAAECGLGASSYFGRQFKKKYGCTPMEYRRRWQDSNI